jgi:hypothetical protein
MGDLKELLMKGNWPQGQGAQLGAPCEIGGEEEYQCQRKSGTPRL